MSSGIDLKGVEQVMAQYDHRETPFFQVYSGKDLKFQQLNDDLEAARAILETHLNQIQQNGSTAPFKIVFFKSVDPEKERVIKDSEMGSNTFRLNQPGMGMQQYYAIQNGDVSPGEMAGYRNNGSNQKIIELLTAMDSRLTAIEQPLEADPSDGEDEDEPDNTKKILGALSGVISHPRVQELLAEKLIGLLNMIPGASTGGTVQQATHIQQPTKPIQMDQTDIERVNAALGTLLSAGMTVNDFEKMASIAQTNPQMLSMFLNMLKQQ
jgi:hypothetical protein